MPSVNFKGKWQIYSHHLSVPYRPLIRDLEKSVSEIDEPEARSQKPEARSQKPEARSQKPDNYIIFGDNLYALKALLPQFSGKVKCIYIDPPYNTGNRDWVYDDNVNSPLMQQWLSDHSPVDDEDLERHDKWLCMMWPRLHLLRELLSDTGSIFVSIDDNEQHHLRMIMDEIFGEENFIANIIWQKKYAPANDSKKISDTHDFILAYAKKISHWSMGLLPRTELMNARYKNRDDDPRGPWKPGGMSAKTYSKDYDYSIEIPNTGKSVLPPNGKSWSFSRTRYEEMLADQRIWFGSSGKAKPQIKQFLSEVKKGLNPQSIWFYTEVSHNQVATKEIEDIFQKKVFETPKPKKLIKQILKVANVCAGDIVLDSFAGSGTTAHAVLEMNKEDGGNRKFILIECEDYASTITANRVKHVIEGYSFKGKLRTRLMREKITWSKILKCDELEKTVKNIEKSYANQFDQFKKSIEKDHLIVEGEKIVSRQVEGLGGSFSYFTLGDPIELEGMLTGDALPSYSTLAMYLIYSSSGISVSESELEINLENGLCYVSDSTNYYLVYEPDLEFLRSEEAMLTETYFRSIFDSTNGKRSIVFGVGKYIGQRTLTKWGITFCQLPYEMLTPIRD